jgi:hypothetical protein
MGKAVDHFKSEEETIVYIMISCISEAGRCELKS